MGPYPDPKYYGHDYISEEDRTELLEWLTERKDEVFDFRQEMEEYCRSDVDILRQACVKFRELLMHAMGEEREVVTEKEKKETKFVSTPIAKRSPSDCKDKYMYSKASIQ